MPLAALRRQGQGSRWRPAIYFLCLGLAFLFVEIACMQRYGLFVGDPLFAAVTVLAGFLVFAAAGSYFASRVRDRPRAQLTLRGRRHRLLLLLQVLALPPPPGFFDSTARV